VKSENVQNVRFWDKNKLVTLMRTHRTQLQRFFIGFTRFSHFYTGWTFSWRFVVLTENCPFGSTRFNVGIIEFDRLIVQDWDTRSYHGHGLAEHIGPKKRFLSKAVIRDRWNMVLNFFLIWSYYWNELTQQSFFNGSQAIISMKQPIDGVLPFCRIWKFGHGLAVHIAHRA
jgi:hypothetical protein